MVAMNSAVKKKRSKQPHLKSPSKKKGEMKKHAVQPQTNVVDSKCPKQNKDCDNCKRVHCPEEKV